jgi:hypothetical protein
MMLQLCQHPDVIGMAADLIIAMYCARVESGAPRMFSCAELLLTRTLVAQPDPNAQPAERVADRR